MAKPTPDRDAATTYECPDCGAALPDEVGVQECECGFVVETFENDAVIPEDVVRIDEQGWDG